MIRVKARYRDQKLELEQPLDLAEGTEVEVEVRPSGELSEREAWEELGASRLETEWDDPADAVYDDWRRMYGR